MSAPFEDSRSDPTTRRKIYKAETRTALLLAAEELFVAGGFAGTSIGAITEAALVAKGTFYNYFPDKMALFAELYTKDAEKIASMLAETCLALESYNASVQSAAAELIEHLLRYSADDKTYREIVLAAPAVLGDEYHQINQCVILPHFNRLLLMLRRRQEPGETGHLEAAAHVLLSGLLESVRVLKDSRNVERDIESYRRTLESMLNAASTFGATP